MNGFGNFNYQHPQNVLSTYNLEDIRTTRPTFALNFNIDPQIDVHTPRLAYMVAALIQQEARKGHPVRVNMFEFVGQNGFDNDAFRELVAVVTYRLCAGLYANEWRGGIDEGAPITIAAVCKAYAGALAASNNQFFQNVAAQDPRAGESIPRDAALWDYFAALYNGQAKYEPFNTGPGLAVAPRSISQNTSFGGTPVSNLASGAFVSASAYQAPASTAEYSGKPNRYERMREALAAQRAEQEANMSAGASKSGFGMRSAMAGINKVNEPAVQPSRAFTSHVAQGAEMAPQQTSFSQPAAQPKGAEPLAVVEMRGQKVRIMRILENGAQLWKPSMLQPNRPAYCVRTHRLSYFETEKGEVLAFLHEITNDQKEINMNYDAHAINPNTGRPIEGAKPVPVREEAKVLYAKEDALKIEVIVKKDITMSDSKESSIKAAMAYGRRNDVAGSPSICPSVVNTAIVLKNEEEVAEVADLLEKISVARTIKEAGPLIDQIKDPYLAKLINEHINKDINDFIVDGLGIVGASVSESVSSYSEELEVALAGIPESGEVYSARFAERVPEILRANTRFTKAVDLTAYADATMSEGDEAAADEALKKRTIFLQRHVNVIYMPYTENELGMVIPGNEALLIDSSYTPLLFKVVQTIKDTSMPLNALMLPDNYVVTSDGKQYCVVRGGLSPQTSLIKND